MEECRTFQFFDSGFNRGFRFSVFNISTSAPQIWVFLWGSRSPISHLFFECVAFRIAVTLRSQSLRFF